MFVSLQHFQILQQVNNDYWFDPQGVLHGPASVWSPIPENNTQPTITPRSAILHSNAGSKPAKWWQLYSYYNNSGVNGESHFEVDNDGVIAQFMSVHRRADCNYSANQWMHEGRSYGAISFETADMGSALLESTGWNLPQIDAMTGALTALAIQYDIGCNQPLAWDGQGIGHHVLFPYQGIGRPAWTNVRGKSCPGRQRILQMPFIRQAVADRVAAFIGRCNDAGIPHGIAGF